MEAGQRSCPQPQRINGCVTWSVASFLSWYFWGSVNIWPYSSTGCPINPAVNRESEPITTGPAAYTSHLAALKKEVSPQILPAFPSCFPKHLSSRWLGCLWRKIPHLYIIVCLLTGGSRAFTADRKHLFWPSALKNLVQVKSDWSCSSVTKGYQY